jgi:threonine dehydrogenase-like Zn-dependent dehydrogenase
MERMRRSEALWYVSDGRLEIRPVDMPAPAPQDVRVAARYSGVSRGTERLVLRGRVPASEHQRMRCPHQEGVFTFPVKYGYALVGVIADGPNARIGEDVFVLHPHQREAWVPLTDVHTLPADLPPRRAALAANMETALNVVWDASIAPGDHVLIVGAGVLGLLIAGIIARIPGTVVTVTDIDPARAVVGEKLGAAYAALGRTPEDQDVVIHTSGTTEGLRVALASAGTEACVVEASWYGDKDISVSLGEAFHARRLQLVSSQVGAVPPARRARWTTARRMAKALELLRDDRYDALITGEIAFTDAPQVLPKVLAEGSPGLMTVLNYA